MLSAVCRTPLLTPCSILIAQLPPSAVFCRVILRPMSAPTHSSLCCFFNQFSCVPQKTTTSLSFKSRDWLNTIWHDRLPPGSSRSTLSDHPVLFNSVPLSTPAPKHLCFVPPRIASLKWLEPGPFSSMRSQVFPGCSQGLSLVWLPKGVCHLVPTVSRCPAGASTK